MYSNNVEIVYIYVSVENTEKETRQCLHICYIFRDDKIFGKRLIEIHFDYKYIHTHIIGARYNMGRVTKLTGSINYVLGKGVN